jgi:hypothetical protein
MPGRRVLGALPSLKGCCLTIAKAGWIMGLGSENAHHGEVLCIEFIAAGGLFGLVTFQAVAPDWRVLGEVQGIATRKSLANPGTATSNIPSIIWRSGNTSWH